MWCASRPARGEAMRAGRRASRSSSSVRPISARIRAKTWRVSATGGLTSARWNKVGVRILSGAFVGTRFPGYRRRTSTTGRPGESMSGRVTETDLVTGAFSYSGSRIAQLLIDSGREVRTLTHHLDREHPLRARVQSLPYRFEDPVALARSLEGVTTLYNTYWVRFERDRTTFANAVANSQALFEAARRAGVARIVHVSIANPSIDSPLPYYRGKALVEQALATAGVPYAIVRPTFFFGGGRD